MTMDSPSVTKPLVDIVVLGPAGHGKTALTAALTKLGKERGGEEKSYDELARATGESLVVYESSSRQYQHVDLPGAAEAIAYMKASLRLIDGAILVCSAADEPTAETTAALKLAREAGVATIVTFINKADAGQRGDAKGLDETARTMLSACGFAGKDAAIIHGSATLALDGDLSSIGVPAIGKLVDALDSQVAIRSLDLDRPFLFSVDDVQTVPLRGSMLNGRVERGTVKAGDAVNVIGLPPPGQAEYSAMVTSLDRSGKLVDRADAGDYVGVRVRPLDRDDARSVQALAAPGSAKADTEFNGRLYPVKTLAAFALRRTLGGWRVQFGLRGASVCSFQLPEGLETLDPESAIDVVITLNAPLWIEQGQRFAVVGYSGLFAYGTVSK